MIFLTKWQSRLVAVFILVVGTWKLGTHLVCLSTWEETPATVEEVTVEDLDRESGETHYQVRILYQFEIGDNSYTSNQLDFFGGDSFIYEDPGEAAVEADQFSSAPPETCRVYPEDPNRSAILPYKELDFSFVLFGIGVLWMVLSFANVIEAWFRGKQMAEDTPSFADDVVPALTFAMLLTISWVALLAIQISDEKKASGWVQTPAKVVESALVFDDDEWIPRVLFTWRGSDGQEHQSRNVTFSVFYGSVTAQERLLDDYQAGAEVVCYVNPDNPRQAVLFKNYQLGSTGMFALAVLAIGACYLTVRAWRAWRSGVQPPAFDFKKLLRPQSPLVVAAAIYLFESLRPAIRELQLGVQFSLTQWFALFALGIVATSFSMLWWRSRQRP